MTECDSLFWDLLTALHSFCIWSKNAFYEDKALPIALRATAVYKRVYSVEILRMHYHKEQHQ